MLNNLMIINYLLIFFTVFFVLYYHNLNFKNFIHNIFNNIQIKFTNIFNSKEKFKIIKLNYVDTQNILKFLQSKFNYDNILIPKDITYKKENEKFVFNNIDIIGIKYINSKEIISKHNINFLFSQNENDTFISNQDLFGINGTFKIISIDNMNDNLKNNIFNKKKQILTEINDTENIFSKVPDIIHLTSESEVEIDSIQDTTDDFNHQFA